MKMIRFSPAKLDRYADEFFETVDYHKNNPHIPVFKDWVERNELAGLALRMWAVRMREANKRAKKKAIAAKAQPHLP